MASPASDPSGPVRPEFAHELHGIPCGTTGYGYNAGRAPGSVVPTLVWARHMSAECVCAHDTWLGAPKVPIVPGMDAREPVDDFLSPYTCFADLLEARASDDAVYLTELHHARGTRQMWSAAQWRLRVRATARWLLDSGVGQGDAVATLAGNTADAVALAFACWLAGVCCVPLNAQESPARQAFTLTDAEAKMLVASPEEQGRAAELSATTGVALRSTWDLPEPVPVSVPVSTDPELPALRLYTSGTTGTPKGVVTTFGNLVTDVDAMSRVYGWGPATRVLTVLPVHHANALVISMLLPWFTGGSTVLTDRFRTERFWADAQTEAATTASLVPTLLEFLLTAPGAAPAGFDEVLCGAGPLLPETALRFESRFGVAVRHLYGLSETTAVSCTMPGLIPADRSHWHSAFGFPSIGAALPHVRMAVLDQDGAELPAGERGELVIRGAIVMREYAGRPEDTARAFAGGWFHSGDEGFWQPGPDGAPLYFITGRMKELIIRGGHNISPFEIDAVLGAHPKVKFGLALAFPHRLYGEEVAAYVVADGPLTEQDVLAHCAERLDFAHCPKVVIFGDDVPYTATGKAKRLELAARLAEELGRHRDTEFRRRAEHAAVPQAQ